MQSKIKYDILLSFPHDILHSDISYPMEDFNFLHWIFIHRPKILDSTKGIYCKFFLHSFCFKLHFCSKSIMWSVFLTASQWICKRLFILPVYSCPMQTCSLSYTFSSTLLVASGIGKALGIPQILLGVKAFTFNEVVCKVYWIFWTGGFLLDLSFKFLCH